MENNNKRGFTLIELIVVVIIIAILVAIATPVFLNQRIAAWKASVQADVSTARISTEQASVTSSGSISDLTFSGGADGSALVISGNGSDAVTSPVSAGNTVTEKLGKTDTGELCYVITGTNKNLGDWKYSKASEPSCGESSEGDSVCADHAKGTFAELNKDANYWSGHPSIFVELVDESCDVEDWGVTITVTDSAGNVVDSSTGIGGYNYWLSIPKPGVYTVSLTLPAGLKVVSSAGSSFTVDATDNGYFSAGAGSFYPSFGSALTVKKGV